MVNHNKHCALPLFFQQDINHTTRLAIWQIAEPELFFDSIVPIQHSITHPHKRLQHLAGRYLLPYLFPDFPHHEIAIASTRKPFLPGEQYHFSISHCGAFAAAIVSSHFRVGIDAELITNRVERIKNKFLHADELRFVNDSPLTNRLQILSLLWSAKEAIYKWYGLGEVDFSDMMQILPFDLKTEGTLHGLFRKGKFEQSLLLHYRLLNDLCLVWVASV